MPFINLRNSTLILNGHTVEGWADEDDALMFPQTTLANVTRGADGKMQASSTGNVGDGIEIKLLATSRSVAFFGKQVQHLKNGGRVVFNGTFIDNINNTTVSLERGVMTEAPDHASLGQGAAGTVTYKIEFEEIKPDFSGTRGYPAPDVVADDAT